MKRNFLSKLPAAILLVLITVLLSASAIYANTPKIKKTEYEGKGKVEVDFTKDVRYKNVSVTVTSGGKTYSTKIVEKDDDDMIFKIKNYKAGKTYTFTISGVKVRGTKGYGSVTGKVKIPKAASSITRSKAISIAVADAKKTYQATDIRQKEAEKDTYKGTKTWEVDFEGKINGKWYEFSYDISRSKGKILNVKKELDD